VDGWVRWYPPDVFPTVWEHLRRLANVGKIVSSEEVFRELERKEDELFAWAKRYKGMFLPLDDAVQASVTEIMAAFPRLVDGRLGKSFADPFVIATARVTERVVITGERPTGKVQRPKIPDVCQHFGVECINLVELFRREKWTF